MYGGSIQSSVYRGFTQNSASGPRYIPDSLYMYLCQVYPYIATLFFIYPSFLTSSLPRKALERQPVEDCRQNQTTVARTRRPPFEGPASERRERFNQSIDRIEPELWY